MYRLGQEVCWYANAMYCPFEVYQKNTFSTRVINKLYQGYLSHRLPFSVLDPLGHSLGPDPPCMGRTKPASHMLGHHVLKNKGF